MTLKKIRLELARDREHPEGSARHGYEFVGPLDDEGHLDPAAWKKHRERCRVRRFWLNEADEIGHLVRKPGGQWAFHYGASGNWMKTRAATGSAIMRSRWASMSRSASTTRM